MILKKHSLSRSRGNTKPFWQGNPVSLLHPALAANPKACSSHQAPNTLRLAKPKPKLRREPPKVPERQKKSFRPSKAPVVAGIAPVVAENAPVVADNAPVVAEQTPSRHEGQFSLVHCDIPVNTATNEVLADLTQYPAQVIVICCRIVGQDWAKELSRMLQQPKDGATEPLYKTYVKHNVIYGHLASSFVVKTEGFDHKAGGIQTLWGIKIFTTKVVCGRTVWNIAVPHMPDKIAYSCWDIKGDLAFIQQNQIRIMVGPHEPLYMERLRDLARSTFFLYYSVQTPLSRESVVLETIGPIRQFTAPKQAGFVLPQPQPDEKGPTETWPPIEQLSIKLKDGPNGMQKLILYVGAILNFRGKAARLARFKKGVHKGLYVDPNDGRADIR